MHMITGATVKLHVREPTGVDAFGAPVYRDAGTIPVENVLICPTSAEDITSDLQMYGKYTVYELHIPKTDTNTWEDRVVEFYGKKWRTVGAVLEWMEPITPGPWNKRVKVERYG